MKISNRKNKFHIPENCELTPAFGTPIEITFCKINNQLKMKTTLRKISIAAALLLSSGFAFAQAASNNLVVFSQDGDKFSLIVNGLRQNEKPETNVKVTGLNAPNYKVRVIFENAGLAPIDQNIYMMDGGENVTNKEITYVISNTKKGMKLRGQSVADITPQGPAAPGQVIYVFNPSGNATSYSTTTTTSGTSTSTGTGTSTNVVVVPANTGAQTTTTVNDGMGGTTSTTTTTTTTGTADNVNMGMNVGGVGVGININVNDGMGGTATSTSTTTTTSSSTTTTSGGGTTIVNDPPPTTTQCAWPMSSSDFDNAKKSVDAQSFEEQKLKVAKQILNTNCMSTAQVKEIMGMFSFEDTKVDWAEFAYGKTTDFNNYYQLNDGFTFSGSVDKLNSYIESHKR
jgi:hypothetical protein